MTQFPAQKSIPNRFLSSSQAFLASHRLPVAPEPPKIVRPGTSEPYNLQACGIPNSWASLETGPVVNTECGPGTPSTERAVVLKRFKRLRSKQALKRTQVQATGTVSSHNRFHEKTSSTSRLSEIRYKMYFLHFFTSAPYYMGPRLIFSGCRHAIWLMGDVIQV